MINYFDLIEDNIDEQLETALKYGFESERTLAVAHRNDKALDKLLQWAVTDLREKNEGLERRKDRRQSEND